MGHLLAGSAASPPTDLWVGRLVRVDCETDDPVDDIRVIPATGPRVVVQCKHTITLQVSPSSEVASAVRQFVNHHRAQDQDSDLLVLCTTSGTGAPLRSALPKVLKRIREAPGSDPTACAHNQAESNALSKFTEHVEREWQAAAGVAPTSEQLRRLLARCHVLVLDVDPGGDTKRTFDRCCGPSFNRQPTRTRRGGYL
jgi:uncharacterized protein (DUF58 family)